MAKTLDPLTRQIRTLDDVEKLGLVDAIFEDLDRPDPETDQIWADEARKRWLAYKAGRAPAISSDAFMAKHRAS